MPAPSLRSRAPARPVARRQPLLQEYAPLAQYPAPRSRRAAPVGELQCSDVADKEVISSVSGAYLGVAAGLLVDASSMTVSTLCLKQKAFSSKGFPQSCLELNAMVQVGDVVLVNQDKPWPQSYAQGTERLLGCHVYTYNGIPVGKARPRPAPVPPAASVSTAAVRPRVPRHLVMRPPRPCPGPQLLLQPRRRPPDGRAVR